MEEQADQSSLLRVVKISPKKASDPEQSADESTPAARLTRLTRVPTGYIHDGVHIPHEPLLDRPQDPASLAKGRSSPTLLRCRRTADVGIDFVQREEGKCFQVVLRDQ